MRFQVFQCLQECFYGLIVYQHHLECLLVLTQASHVLAQTQTKFKLLQQQEDEKRNVKEKRKEAGERERTREASLGEKGAMEEDGSSTVSFLVAHLSVNHEYKLKLSRRSYDSTTNSQEFLHPSLYTRGEDRGGMRKPEKKYVEICKEIGNE